MKNAIIIGASSGIGKALATILSQQSYCVALLARREELLADLQQSLPGKTYTRQLDIADVDAVQTVLSELIHEMGNIDLIVVSAGVGYINKRLTLDKELETIAINVTGFTTACNIAFKHFVQNKQGHLVGISSISAIRGHGQTLAYNASKAYMSSYLQGLCHRAIKSKLPIVVTDIKPGYVATAMAKGDGMFWVSSPEKAAQQIYAAIKKKKRHVYITKRWRMVAWLLKLLPDFIYHRVM